MNRPVFVPMLLLVLAWPCSASPAEVYRWVDDQGGVHFGDRPPPNGDVQVLDIESCETPRCRTAQAEAATRLEALQRERQQWWEDYRRREGERAEQRTQEKPEPNNEIPFYKFRLLQPGLSKGEVLLKVGQADVVEDLESPEGGIIAQKWTYLPRLRGGWLSELFFDRAGYLTRLVRTKTF
jgi:hypothetical protein